MLKFWITRRLDDFVGAMRLGFVFITCLAVKLRGEVLDHAPSKFWITRHLNDTVGVVCAGSLRLLLV